MPDSLRQQSSWSGSTTLLSVFLYDTYQWPCVRARPLHWQRQASSRRSRRGWSLRSSPSRGSRRPPSVPGTFGCFRSYRRNTLYRTWRSLNRVKKEIYFQAGDIYRSNRCHVCSLHMRFTIFKISHCDKIREKCLLRHQKIRKSRCLQKPTKVNNQKNEFQLDNLTIIYCI